MRKTTAQGEKNADITQTATVDVFVHLMSFSLQV